jgi:hypothetical protein
VKGAGLPVNPAPASPADVQRAPPHSITLISRRSSLESVLQAHPVSPALMRAKKCPHSVDGGGRASI